MLQIQIRMNWISIASLCQPELRSEMSLNVPDRSRQMQCFCSVMSMDY